MPGRTPDQARTAFLGPLYRALSGVTRAQFFYRPHAPGETEILTLSESPLELGSDRLGRLGVALDQQYVLVETEGRASDRWKVSTRAYRYRIDGDGGSEMASWHWHPEVGPPRPHAHVQHGPLAGLHLPTGRVSIEGILRFLIVELGVPPLRDDWQEVLDVAQEEFEGYRTWP